MFNYNAPNPYSSSPSSLSKFLSSLFGSSSSSSSSFSSSESIGDLIVPAQQRRPKILSEENKSALERNMNVRIEEGTVNTYDGAQITTLQIKPPEQINNRHIIKFNGNGAQHIDSVDEFTFDAVVLKATVIGFNYRGVGTSTPKPKKYKNLVTDGIAQVQRLLDQGVASESILLDGRSLGGSVATMVAAHFHAKNLPVYLWNDRSFSSVARAAAGIITPHSVAKLESVSAASTYSVLEPAHWDAQVADAYNSIPAKYKGYMFVSKKSANGKGDGVISNPASLHKGVKFFEQAHTVTGHKLITTADVIGHNVSRDELTTKDGLHTGQGIFEEFVNSHMTP